MGKEDFGKVKLLSKLLKTDVQFPPQKAERVYGPQLPPDWTSDVQEGGDFVVTPNGTIHTDPNDFIMATKNPGALGGGVTINIENLYSSSPDEMVEVLQERLNEEIKY